MSDGGGEEYLGRLGLIARGWTDGLITRHLALPDLVEPRRPVRWRRSRVEAVERSTAFRAERARLRAAARAARPAQPALSCP